MKSQTVLGFDFGLRHIGVAVGQTVTGTASPLETIKAQAGKPQWDKINQLITVWKPDVLMVGLPLTSSGGEQPILIAAKRFARQLQERYKLPVQMIDERYSTREAKSALFDVGGYRALEKSKIDSWSAKIITESGLNQMMKATPKKPTTRHFLSTQNLSESEIYRFIDRANTWLDHSDQLQQLDPLLAHKTIANLFFENSTRTRCSFELAAQRLGGNVLNFDAASSSLQKGESFFDTLDNLQTMGVDLFVLRHPENLAAQQAAEHLQHRAVVINAGDGTNEHPTQAMLDALTIFRCKNDFKNLNIAIVGDIRHSRVARSNIYTLTTLGVKSIRLIAPAALLAPDLNASSLTQYTDLVEGIQDADVIMVLRIQKERMQQATLLEVDQYYQGFGLNAEKLKYAKPDAIVMHPGPMNRGIEIDTEVADGPQSVILKQAKFGVAMRMAIMAELLSL
jgi:aspartate carbamoyltransferase catalytic subunit